MSVSNNRPRQSPAHATSSPQVSSQEFVATPQRSNPNALTRVSKILNGTFHQLLGGEVVDEVVRVIHAGERGALCTVNVAILMMMRSNIRLQRIVDGAKWTVADGQPLVWASHLTEKALPERVTGIDLIDLLCARATQEGIGVYFLGGSREIVGAAVAALRNRHSGLDVRGYADGYFDQMDASARAQAVSRSGAQILFVAMGVPRQEYFIEEQWDNLGAAVVIGVGGSLDVIAGLRRRAPPFLQRAGLEWAYRLFQEPRQLFARYAKTNLLFFYLIISNSIFPGALRPLRIPARTKREIQ